LCNSGEFAQNLSLIFLHQHNIWAKMAETGILGPGCDRMRHGLRQSRGLFEAHWSGDEEAMRSPHNGIDAPKAHLPLRQVAAAPICAREAVIEFLLSSHTSLLDLAERKLGLFFGISLRCGGKGRNPRPLRRFGPKTGRRAKRGEGAFTLSSGESGLVPGYFTCGGQNGFD